MGDVGDYWREHKEYVKEQKQKHRSKASMAMQEVNKSGLDYRELSNEHFRVSLTNDWFDWWPSTGYWKSKDGKQTGYGVFKLIKAAKAKEKQAA